MFLLPFHCVSVSHEANAADVVGRLRLASEHIAEALADLHRRQVPAVLLSTCHRTELYWWGDDVLLEWFTHLVLGRQPGMTVQPQLVQLDADLAVRHLFSVASGMKSARFGEPEILGQVRRAWTLARRVGTSHGAIDGAFRAAIEAARHVRAAMGNDADASLGDRVQARLRAALAARTGHRTGIPQIVVVGSGDAARGVLRALRRSPVAQAQVQVHVTSRTDTRAAALAGEFGCAVVPWAHREEALREADAVVFAVHVTSPLVSAAFAQTMPAVPPAAIWVDLGVPGAVAPDFEPPCVELISLATLDAEDAAAEHAARRAEREARQRRAAHALQRELARYARTTHRHSLGAKLGELEAQAVEVASSLRDAPMDEMVRKVTRLVLREFSRA